MPAMTALKNLVLMVDPRSLVASNLNLTFNPESAGGMGKVYSNRKGLLAMVAASRFVVKGPFAPSSLYTA